MRISKYILRKVVKASDSTKAMEIIRKQYPNARLITYKFKTNLQKKPMSERNYSNRWMWVWFIKNVETIKREI